MAGSTIVAVAPSLQALANSSNFTAAVVMLGPPSRRHQLLRAATSKAQGQPFTEVALSWTRKTGSQGICTANADDGAAKSSKSADRDADYTSASSSKNEGGSNKNEGSEVGSEDECRRRK